MELWETFKRSVEGQKQIVNVSTSAFGRTVCNSFLW